MSADRVVIVGGGPVGMVLALNIAALGVRSTIVNRETGPRWHPKGSTQNARTMEHYRRLGIVGKIRAVGLPCYCVGVTPNSPARSGPGTVGFPVALAGHPVASGDVIVADLDGVVVVPRARLDEVIARLPAIRNEEAAMDQAVRDGLRLPKFK